MPVYKYQKKCRLPRCGQEFQTNRKWQEFCGPDHQKEFQKLIRRHHEDVIVEVESLKEDMKKMKAAFEKLKDRIGTTINLD